MTDAAVLELIYEINIPIPFTVSNGTGIARGQALTLSDPMTVATSTDSTAACGGVAAEEKIASDGKTKMAVYRDGIFKATCSGAITVGQAVALEDNYVHQAQVAHEHTAGVALETGADTETILFELHPTHFNDA